MKQASLVFPHQLFENNPCIAPNRDVYIIEEYLFFRQYKFHKQKIAFHRSTMKFYEDYLNKKGYRVIYVDALGELCDIRKLLASLANSGVTEIHVCDVCDDWLEQRIRRSCAALKLKIHEYESLLFINTRKEILEAFQNKRRLNQTEFYKEQRKKRKILVDDDLHPLGSHWTFDAENRLKYPANKVPPTVIKLPENGFDTEANTYVEKNFTDNYGQTRFKYPSNYREAESWLQDFLERRFHDFGKYEDAIIAEESTLHHALLSPLLNVGLLNPALVISKAIAYASRQDIPINSLEGFIRQILGWREFIRAVYLLKGGAQRTRNFWNFTNRLPASFYDGSTGLLPVDVTIKKLLNTAYNHHIERLMVLGNIMVLCEIHPDDVYQWFMEMYIDAYDWVMVPNVYGMSQFADGGLMSTKPYISGSNYLNKMSNYPKGNWQKIWDGLFWSFLNRHHSFFLQNPRLNMLMKSFDKMDSAKQNMHLENAEGFMKNIRSRYNIIG